MARVSDGRLLSEPIPPMFARCEHVAAFSEARERSPALFSLPLGTASDRREVAMVKLDSDHDGVGA
jgi:hypothetical protein